MGVLSWVSERGENVNTAPKVQVTETSTCLCDGEEGTVSNGKASLK